MSDCVRRRESGGREARSDQGVAGEVKRGVEERSEEREERADRRVGKRDEGKRGKV